jgi:hypothetical protein
MKYESVGILTRFLTALAVDVRRRPLLVAVAFGLCCSAGLLLTVGSTLNQSLVDAYVYAGYINDYPGLLERFGRTYYSTRIAFIYPARAFTYLLGLEGGYFALRFLALASAVTAVFSIGTRFYGFVSAILAAVWLSFTPWLPRSLLWTNYDGMAVVYLLVGMALLLVPVHRRLISHVAAGVSFALAVNCNLTVLAVCVLLGPGWVFFYRREGVAWLGRALLALAVGFFGTYLALALILYVQFPQYGFFFDRVTIRIAWSLLGGQTQAWFHPLSTIIWQDHTFTLLIPIIFALAVLLVGVRRSSTARTTTERTDFAVFAVYYTASIVCLALGFHFGFHDGWLSTPLYTIYFLPGCVLALIALGGEARQRGGRIFGAAALCGGAGLTLLWWLARDHLPVFKTGSNFYFWLVVGAATVGAALALRRVAVASVMLIAGAVLLSFCMYQDKFYDIRIGSSYDQVLEWDVYRGAVFLQQFVDASVRPSQPIGFWYSNKRELPQARLNAIQSMYLWDYTRVFASSRDNPGMPVIDEEFRRRLAGRQFLALLGVSDAEADAGLAALEAAAVPYHEVKRTHFQGQEWGYTAILMQLNPPSK